MPFSDSRGNFARFELAGAAWRRSTTGRLSSGFEFETDMRWFVEVSRVGESGVAEEYCVEAKQWQAALQEARKLRGDSGALSQFSIELLDHGYRAVDPTLKLRYLVTKAPDDAKLTGSSTNHPKPAEMSGGKLRVAERTTSFATSVAPAASTGPASLVPRPGSHSPPRPSGSVPPRASNAAPRLVIVPDDLVPPAPPVPGAPVPELAPAAPPVAEPLPSFEVVRERSEEPRADSPITYRELAFAVAPDVTRAQVEALLQDRYHATRATIEDRPAGKFVQLAVFDHVFKRKPERPPLATFAWKDWRGEPIVAFPGFGEAPMAPLSQVPPALASSLPSANGAHSAPPPGVAASLSMLPLPSALGPAPAAPVPVVNEPPPVVNEPPPVVNEQRLISLAPTRMVTFETPPLAVVPPPAPTPVVAEPPPVIAEPVAVPAPPGFEPHFGATPINAVPASQAKSERVSRPRLAAPGRRRAGEDLIGELFEFMHELHFQRDVATGADFVLSVLNEVLPCDGVLIHVFDINTGHFVIVRAKGPNASAVLLQRLPDQDPFVQSVMRSPRSVALENAANDARFNGPRWQAVGVLPKYALCGAVQLGGRYLGLIELVNPQGDTPFHTGELNALDYICEQFADFLSKKPLVLAADVVLARV